MKDSILKMFNIKGFALTMCGLLAMFGLVNSASAECVVGPTDPSGYTLLIDASSSCDNLSPNMFGCEVDGSGACTITNPNTLETISVTLTNGNVGGTTPIDWAVTNPLGGLVDLAIIVGANNGGSCGTSYSPGSASGEGLIFLKNNGSNQKVNAMFFCSDFSEPPPDVPRLILKKTVTKGADCSFSTDLLDVSAGDEVRYCYTVENVGAGLAEAVTLSDDAGTPGDTGDDFTVTLSGLNGDGSLSGTATGSELVTISEVGTVVNTATASATGLGGTVAVTATDTATVKAEQVAEICPANFQDAVNQLSLLTGLDFAFLQDPNQGGRRAVCVPDGDNGAANTIRVACKNECVTKPICETDPSNPACSPSVCEPSGAWTTGTGTQCSAVTNPPPGTQPYCWEVQQDLNKDCTLNEWDPQEETVLHIKKGHVNPFVYQSCYSSGGRYVCETMCFLYPGDTAADCPPNSTVF